MENAQLFFFPENWPRPLLLWPGKCRTKWPEQILRWLWAKKQAVMEFPPWLPFLLEWFALIFIQFCFPNGETRHAEGGEANAFPSSKPARQSGRPPAGNPAVGLPGQPTSWLAEISAFRRIADNSVGRVKLGPNPSGFGQEDGRASTLPNPLTLHRVLSGRI
jgi:hypothetical protein